MLENKNVFITGASGGLGSQIALEFAKQGCNLYLTGRKDEKLSALISDLHTEIQTEQKVYFKTGDLENLQEVEDIISDAKDKLGGIDILVNCAGVFIVKPFEETKNEHFDSSFNLNVKVPFILCREFMEDMVKNQWGRIINIGSSSAYNGFKETSVYCASKHALLGLTRSLYDEYKDHNVRAFCFSPGSIKTEMGRKVKNQDFDTFINPEEIAKYIIFSISFDQAMISNEVQLKRVNL
jgi:short-subunit dehydrogenase